MDPIVLKIFTFKLQCCSFKLYKVGITMREMYPNMYYNYIIVKPRLSDTPRGWVIYDRWAFQIVEGLLSTLFFSHVTECYKLYYPCYIPALLNQRAALSLQMHIEMVWGFAPSDLVCHSIQWLLLHTAQLYGLSMFTVTHWGPWGYGFEITGDWLTACFLGELSFCPQSFELELSSQLSVYCGSVYYTQLYSIHYPFCWSLLLSLFSLTAGPITAVCVLCLPLPSYV